MSSDSLGASPVGDRAVGPSDPSPSVSAIPASIPGAKPDTRYPYTYACDYVRSHVSDFHPDFSVSMKVPTISRAQASQAISGIALALGMSHQALAEAIANHARGIGAEGQDAQRLEAKPAEPGRR